MANVRTEPVTRRAAPLKPGVAAPLFSNLGKGSKDFLSKGFPGTYKVEITTASQHGLSFVSTAERKVVNKANHLVSTFQPKYKLTARGLELVGTVDTDNKVKAELSLEDLFVPGLKTALKGTVGAEQDVEFNLEYKHEAATLASSLLHHPHTSKSIFSASTTLSRQAFTAGLETKYTLSPDVPAGGSLTSLTGAVNYKDGTYDLTAFVRSEAASGTAGSRPVLLGAHLFFAPTQVDTFVTTLDYDLNKTETKVTVGASHKVDDVTEVKGKLASSGLAHFAVSKQLYPTVKATFGAEVNTSDLAGTTPKFGLHFDIKA